NARDAARKAQQAAASVNDNMLKEKIEYSKEAMTAGSQYTKPLEDDISNGMQAFRNKIADAAGAATKADQGQGMTRALNQATNVLRGMQQLDQQMQSQSGQQQNGDQQGQQGQGQQGQQPGQGQKGQ